MTEYAQARAYVDSIRNDRKRHYAREYLDWLNRVEDSGETSPEPPHGLSYLAAQAVRLHLRGIIT